MKRTLVSLILGGFLTLPGWFPGGALQAEVLSGLDVLARDGFVPLKGKKVGIVTNCTGKDRKGNKIADLVFNAPGVTLAALFAPEHGLTGTENGIVPSGEDPEHRIPIHSLYGATTKPTPEMLKPLDVLLFDLQDVGARYYTYITTMAK